MKTILTVLHGLFILSSGLIMGQQQDKIYGKPLIVLTERNPWATVIGSDVPTFAMYENGQIIYKKQENEQLKFYEVRLTKEELQEVIKSFLILESIYKLDDRISLSYSTDQPSNHLFLNIDLKKTIIVYGNLDKQSKDRQKAPEQLLTVYDNIKNYKNSSAKEWLPARVEVIFWDYKYAATSRPWPKEFPDLNSNSTLKSNSDSYSVFIDRKLFEPFKKFYLSMEEKQAVEINNRKMAISYRFPFPNIK